MMILRPSRGGGGGEGFLRGSCCSSFSLERVSRNSSGSNSLGVSVKEKKIGYHFLFAGYLVYVFQSSYVSV